MPWRRYLTTTREDSIHARTSLLISHAYASLLRNHPYA